MQRASIRTVARYAPRKDSLEHCVAAGQRAHWIHVGHLFRMFCLPELHVSVPKPSNQAMQLTASKPAIYGWSVCRRERMLRGMHRGLVAADLVAR